jgi:quercetin dioxygenase-like cupin family protein
MSNKSLYAEFKVAAQSIDSFVKDPEVEPHISGATQKALGLLGASPKPVVVPLAMDENTASKLPKSWSNPYVVAFHPGDESALEAHSNCEQYIHAIQGKGVTWVERGSKLEADTYSGSDPALEGHVQAVPQNAKHLTRATGEEPLVVLVFHTQKKAELEIFPKESATFAPVR